MFGESVFALIPDHEVRAAKLTNRSQMRGSSTWDTTRVSFDSCTNRHRSSLPRLKPICSVSTPARNSAKSRLAVRLPFIAPCSLQIHPSRSCPFGGRANISQRVCLHTPGLRFPLEDRTMLRTAMVHALTKEMGLAQMRHLSLSSRNPSAHISTSLHSTLIVEPDL